MSSTNRLTNRLEILIDQHKILNKKVDTLYKNYAADSIVEELKIKKLRLKDEINRLERKLRESE